MDEITNAGSSGPGETRLLSGSLTQREADEFLADAAARLQRKFGPTAPDASGSSPPLTTPHPGPAAPPAAGVPASESGPVTSPPRTGTSTEQAGSPDRREWAGVLDPPFQSSSGEFIEYICLPCHAIFAKQPIIRRSRSANTIKCPACQRDLFIAPDRRIPGAARTPASRPAAKAPSRGRPNAADVAKADPSAPFRAAAHRKRTSLLQDWLGDMQPRDYGARLMQVVTHPDARRLARELHLFRPRASLGMGPFARSLRGPDGRPIRQSQKSRRAQQISLDPVHLAALIEFRRHLKGHAADGVRGPSTELIHPGTSASCACGCRLRCETTGSRDGALRLVVSGGRATHADCDSFSTVRVSVLNDDLKSALTARLTGPPWVQRLFQALTKSLRRARAHHRRAAASGRPHRPDESKGCEPPRQTPTDSQLIPYDGPFERCRSVRELKTLMAVIRQLPRAQEPHVLSPPLKLALRKLARRLERRRLRGGVSETDFLERCAMTAGLLGSLPGPGLRLDRLVDSVVIGGSPSSPGETRRLRAKVTIHLRELLKLILPPTWHRVLDQFAQGRLQIEIPVGERPRADALRGPVQLAVLHGQTQDEIASDFDISQTQVSLLARAPTPEMRPACEIPLTDRARIRRAERRAEIRRSLTFTPTPGTRGGDDARVGRLNEALRRFKVDLCPFSEAHVPSSAGPATPGAARGGWPQESVWPLAFPPSDTPGAASGANPLSALLTILPLKAEDVSFACSLVARRADPAASGAPEDLWQRLQAHFFDRDPRPTCRWDQRFAMQKASATLSRFLRGQIEARDPVLAALMLRELGGWIPLLMDALKVAGCSSWEIAPRLGLGPDVVQVYQGLFDAAVAPDWLPEQQRTAMDRLRALLIAAARKGRDSFDVFLAAMRALGRLPATVDLGPGSHIARGDLLAQEIVFQRAWITPTDRNGARIDRLERRLAELTGGLPGQPTLTDLLAALAGRGFPS